MLQYQHSQKSDKQPWFSLLSLHFSLLSLLFKKIWTLKTLVKVNKLKITGASPVAQQWRICLPVQGPWVQSLVREDPTCRIKTACAPESRNLSYWALAQQLLKPVCPRAHAQQQEKLSQSDAHAPQLENSLCSNKDPVESKNKLKL